MSNKRMDSIFGIPIALVTVEENTDILQFYDGWKEAHPHKKSINHTTVSKDIRILESYPEIKKILLDQFISFSYQVLGLNNQFEISTSWLTKTVKGESAFTHAHSNCFWSGVYFYGEKYCESSPLVFENPLKSTLLTGIFPYPTRATDHNKFEYELLPCKNTLVLFPSYLKHKILEHKSEFPRYSLAFNIVPIGEYGVEDSTYNTSWFH